jgi:hypothetical protein
MDRKKLAEEFGKFAGKEIPMSDKAFIGFKYGMGTTKPAYGFGPADAQNDPVLKAMFDLATEAKADLQISFTDSSWVSKKSALHGNKPYVKAYVEKAPDGKYRVSAKVVITG